jgi:hypothetical protein
MASGKDESRPLNIFISYSRDDIDFADQLEAALRSHKYEVTLDRHGISGGEDWKSRLGVLIGDADTVVFVLSPASARSEICAWEVSEAVRVGKRIIPVVCRQLQDASPPPELAHLNYIFFCTEPRVPGSGFGTGLAGLVAALNTDLDWLREHTRLLARATEWQAAGRQANRMLAGGDIAQAKAWAANRPKDAPPPTDLQLEFIRASEEAEAERTNAERMRLEEMRVAQAERARALADREAAVRKLSRRTTIGLMSSGALTVAAAGFAYWGNDAERRFRVARRRAADAEKNSLEAAIAKEAMRTDIVGQFAAYAASPNQFASEGPRGGNSPYTAELLSQLSNVSVSLYEACFTGHLNIQRNSITHQRPFLSTDMNGNIYLMRQPETRTRKAVIVSVDRLYQRGELYNVKNDALAWEAFLKDRCGFEVVRLENPDTQAFTNVFSDLAVKRPTRQGYLGQSPLLHKAGFRKINPDDSTAAQSIEPDDNTMVMFVFAGFGAYKGGENYLMTNNSDGARIETLTSTMVPLTPIQDALRRAAAASILILDSNFPDLDKLGSNRDQAR